MGSPFSKTRKKSKTESSRSSTVSRFDPAHDAVPAHAAGAARKTSYSSKTTTFQVQREQKQVSNFVRTTTTHTASGSASAGPTPPRYSPVYKRPSLVAPVDALRIESSPRVQGQPTSDKYDLSKSAHVLVLHHYEFDNKADNRQGSMKDMEKIKEVLSKYRTDAVKVHSNLPRTSVRRVMDGVSVKDFSKNSCLMVFIMSHGNTQDSIMASDGTMYSFHDDIVEKCASNATLKGKPKIFILQACRGEAHMRPDSTRKTTSGKFDIVTMQSTYEGSVSWRDVNKGSFFMQSFLKLLQTCDNLEIQEMNRRLNQSFSSNGSEYNQTPTISSTLQKQLVLGDLRK